MSDEDLKRCLDVLKTSDLRFSLVCDVIAFTESDKSYNEAEQQQIKIIAAYLKVSSGQLSLLYQFTKKAIQEIPKNSEALVSEETTPSNFLESLGFGYKMKNAGYKYQFNI
ncbi:MAG: hypothetical protein H7296_15035 [Bacteroidia bacterium]|nr:hypothetical protein [Bacteroidia bacterium]